MELAKRSGMLAVSTAIKLRFDYEATVTTREVIREASIKALSDRATSVGNPPSVASRYSAGVRSVHSSPRSSAIVVRGSGGGSRSGVLKEEKEGDEGSRARSAGSRGSRPGAAALSTKVTEEAIRAMTRAMQENGGNITAAALALVNQQHAGTAAVARAFRPHGDDDLSVISSSTYNTNPGNVRRRSQTSTLRRSGDDRGLEAIREEDDGPVVRHRALSTAPSARSSVDFRLASRSTDRTRVRVFQDEDGADIVSPRPSSMFCFSWGAKKPPQQQQRRRPSEAATSGMCLVLDNQNQKKNAKSFCVIM
jgi:hypothetical protein